MITLVLVLRHSVEKRSITYGAFLTDSDHEDSPGSGSEEEDEASEISSDEEVSQFRTSLRFMMHQ